MTQRGRDPGPPGRPGGGGRPGPVPSARRPGDARPGERRPDRDRGRGRAERGEARPREVPPPGRDGTRAARTGGAGARGLGDATVRSGYPADKSASRPSRPKSGGPPRTGQGGPRRPPRRPRRPRQFTVRRGEPGRRLGITLLVILFVLTIFGGRLVQIQGMESGYYIYKANQLRLQTNTLPAVRGTIYGADGQILAMTVATYQVWADPPQIRDKPTVAQQLAGPLGMPAATILGLLGHPTSPQYVVLAKGVSAASDAAITSLNITGIYDNNSDPTYARDYPDGNATANVVGFTNVSQKDVIAGEAGVEEEYDKLLSGTQGSEQVEHSNTGQPIPGTELKGTPAVNGQGIKLTIIPALQLAAQQACQQEVQKIKAKECTVVIIAPKTGYILAMAQWPTYSQANLTNVADTVNLPASYLFAPGSTAKVITAAAALERGGLSLMTPTTSRTRSTAAGRPSTTRNGRLASTTRSPGSSRTRATSACRRWWRPSRRRCSTSTCGRSASAQPTGLDLPGESPGHAAAAVASGRATSGTRWRSARASR